MTTEQDNIKAQEATKEEPASLEDMLKELPIPEKHKAVLTNLVTGLLQSIVQVNERLAAIENKPAVQEPATVYDDLTPEQKYNVLMAKASAPAAQAQMQLAQGLLSGLRGGNSGGGLEELVKSAKGLSALRELLMPEPTPLQIAMEKAQIQQSIAQTRLMNKIVGKTSMDYLDKLEASLVEGNTE